MILVFNKKYVPVILAGIKVHTIRKDEQNLWQPSMAIHMVSDEPGNLSNTFNDNIPELQTCISTQRITITYYMFPTAADAAGHISGAGVKIDGRALSPLEIHELAVADGFNNIDDFFNWFTGSFTGKLIHWTNKKY